MMMKRGFRIALTVFLSMAVLVFPVSAEGASVYVDSSDTQVKRGDSFKVTVYSTAIQGAIGIEIKLDFDPNVFQVTAVEGNESLPLVMSSTVDEANKNGMAGSVFLDMGSLGEFVIPDNTAYLQLTMQARKDAALGSSDIHLEEFSAYNEAEEALSVDQSAGTISVTVSDSKTVSNDKANSKTSLSSGSVIPGAAASSSAAATASDGAAASASADSGEKQQLTFCDCEGKQILTATINKGEYYQGPREYQYDSYMDQSGDIILKPSNCLADGYVVVNTYSSGNRIGATVR